MELNINKKVELLFWDCHASMDIEYQSDNDGYTLALTEYQIDEEQSSENNSRLKRASVTEVYLSEEEIKEVIQGLQYLLTEKE